MEGGAGFEAEERVPSPRAVGTPSRTTERAAGAPGGPLQLPSVTTSSAGAAFAPTPRRFLPLVRSIGATLPPGHPRLGAAPLALPHSGVSPASSRRFGPSRAENHPIVQAPSGLVFTPLRYACARCPGERGDIGGALITFRVATHLAPETTHPGLDLQSPGGFTDPLWPFAAAIPVSPAQQLVRPVDPDGLTGPLASHFLA